MVVMIETIFALLLIMDHQIIEHRIQPTLSMCLKRKRIAERSDIGNNRIQHKCIKSKAEVEINIDGSHTIKKLILE
jgi:hypothetical protein